MKKKMNRMGESKKNKKDTKKVFITYKKKQSLTHFYFFLLLTLQLTVILLFTHYHLSKQSVTHHTSLTPFDFIHSFSLTH